MHRDLPVFLTHAPRRHGTFCLRLFLPGMSAVLLALSVAGCTSDRDENEPTANRAATSGESDSVSVDRSVRIHLNQEEIPSRGSFTVTFEHAADDSQLVLGPGLTLRQGDRKLNTLVVRDVFSAPTDIPAVLPPDSPLPKIALPGTGPFRFELPPLESDEYQVCARVVLKLGDDLKQGDVCGEFMVV